MRNASSNEHRKFCSNFVCEHRRWGTLICFFSMSINARQNSQFTSENAHSRRNSEMGRGRMGTASFLIMASIHSIRDYHNLPPHPKGWEGLRKLGWKIFCQNELSGFEKLGFCEEKSRLGWVEGQNSHPIGGFNLIWSGGGREISL